jgi:hypothetical protein
MKKMDISSRPQKNNENDAHIKTLKEEILEDSTEKFMEKIPDMVNQHL